MDFATYIGPKSGSRCGRSWGPRYYMVADGLITRELSLSPFYYFARGSGCDVL